MFFNERIRWWDMRLKWSWRKAFGTIRQRNKLWVREGAGTLVRRGEAREFDRLAAWLVTDSEAGCGWSLGCSIPKARFLQCGWCWIFLISLKCFVHLFILSHFGYLGDLIPKPMWYFLPSLQLHIIVVLVHVYWIFTMCWAK